MRVKANKGAAGVDGESIEQFEADLRANLYKLWNRIEKVYGAWWNRVVDSEGAAAVRRSADRYLGFALDDGPEDRISSR